MDEVHMDFLCELLRRFSTAFASAWNCNIQIKEHIDYRTIDLCFSNGNSRYEDSIVLYLGETDFDPDQTLEDFDDILEKAKVLLG